MLIVSVDLSLNIRDGQLWKGRVGGGGGGGIFEPHEFFSR